MYGKIMGHNERAVKTKVNGFEIRLLNMMLMIENEAIVLCSPTIVFHIYFEKII